MVDVVQAPVLKEADAEFSGMDSEQLERAADYVAGKVRDGAIPLASILVARRGKIVLRRAFVHPRLADEGVRVEPDTIFRLASVTKVLTATLVMQNVEMGRLSLDTPVAEYIPEFGKNGKEAVSPRHLLSHSSGMSDKIDGPRPTSFAELLERVYERPLEFEPGTRSSYCTVAFDVLVELMQRATGKSIEQLGSELLFGPLGMSSSHFGTSDEGRERVLPLFDRDLNVVDDPFDGRPAPRYHMKLALGGTNGRSNADDLAILCQMMLNGGGFENTRVLSPISVQRMVERQFPWWDSPDRLSSPQKYFFISKGLGWMVRGESHYRGSDIMSPRAFFHGGSYGSRALVDPQYDLFTIFLTCALHDAPPGPGHPPTFPITALHHHHIHHTFGTMAFAAVTEL